MLKKAKYLEIRDFVAFEILKGNIKDGDKLFTKTFFINKFRVNPKYIDKAYEQLLLEGLVEQREDNYYLLVDDDKIERIIVQFANEFSNEYLHNMSTIGMKLTDVMRFLNKRLQAHG